MRRVISLKTVTIFWLGGGHFSKLLTVHGVNDFRQAEIHTAEALVPDPSNFVVEIAIERLKDTNHQVLDKLQQS
jgi:hypothetical protein